MSDSRASVREVKIEGEAYITDVEVLVTVVLLCESKPFASQFGDAFYEVVAVLGHCGQ
jgi:hypothetical protein